jgi:hypothetical protein
MISAIIHIVMEQGCPGCGFVSDRPSRYCRQCGKQLVLENELTSAETRNYDSIRAAQAANVSYPSHHEAQAYDVREVQETAPFYTPPRASNYDIPEKKKSRTGLWLVIALLCILLVGGGLVALAVRFFRPPRQAATAAVERRFPFPPPPPQSPPDGPQASMPAIFDKYKYPNAIVDQTVSGIGIGDFIKMSTTDTVGVVSDFYKRVIKAPPINESRDNDNEEGQVIFQASNSPPILVIIGPDDELPGKTQIVLIHSNFQIPKQRF